MKSKNIYNKRYPLTNASRAGNIIFRMLSVLSHAVQRGCLLIVFLQVCSTALAQAKNEHRLEAMANPKADKIQLRWAPASYIAWEIGNKYGYLVERFTLTANGVLVDKPAVSLLTPQPVKAYTLEQMEAASEKDEKTGGIAENFYGEQKKAKPEEGIGAFFENKNQNDWRMAMALFTCDLSVAAAQSAGLFLEDREVKKGEKYFYRIFAAQQPKNLAIDTAYVFASLDNPKSLAPPQELTLACADSTATLGWLTTITKGMYSAWLMERSSDGKKFAPVSDLPIIPTNPDARGFSYYQDKLPDNEKTYHYRLRGITPFGEYGPYSEEVKGMGMPAVSERPVMDTIAVIENKKIELRWQLPGELPKQLSRIIVTRSENSGGPYEAIAELKPKTLIYVDKKPMGINYYRIKGVSKRGKEIYSFPYFAQLTDISPPAPPTGIEGKIDSAGAVTLSWKANAEKDLQGYRVFRANSLREEFVEVKKIILPTQSFMDTVNIHTLPSKVFYKVIAVDKNFNPSEYSEPLTIKRPDIIPPVSPVFTKTYRSDSLKAIVLKWINSPSEDAAKYILRRINVKDSRRTEAAAWEAADKRESYIDKGMEQGKTYRYELTVVDDSGNKTKEISGDVFFETGKRNPVAEWTAEGDAAKKQVLLRWKCDEPNIKKYYIYRSKNNAPYILFQTIDGKESNYTDNHVTSGAGYRYRITAVLPGDVKTEASKEAEALF